MGKGYGRKAGGREIQSKAKKETGIAQNKKGDKRGGERARKKIEKQYKTKFVKKRELKEGEGENT